MQTVSFGATGGATALTGGRHGPLATPKNRLCFEFRAQLWRVDKMYRCRLVHAVFFIARCALVQSAVLRSYVVCQSVCPSVTLVDCDHIGWNSSKIISPLVSLGCSLSAGPNKAYSKENTRKFGPKVIPPHVDLSVGDIRSQIAAEWLQIAQRSQWRAYRKPPSLFWVVPSLTPYDLPFPQNGGSVCLQDTQMVISAMGDPIQFMFDSRVYRVFRVGGSNCDISGLHRAVNLCDSTAFLY